VSSKRRVAVTGLGIVSPLGVGLAANHAAVTEGRSGIGPITRFDPAGQPCAIAGEVGDFDLATATDGVVAAKEVKKMDRFIQFGMAAGIEAVADSGIEVTEANAARIGVCIGSGIGGVETIENTAIAVRDKGPRRVSPFYIPMSIINMISGNLSILYGMRGPNLAMVTACTTGTHAIGHTRMATESDVDIRSAHPYWAYPFNDIALVHNGQLTNYWNSRRALERRGHRFMSNCDSELIAVYLADALHRGGDLEEAMHRSVGELDGVFTYVVATGDKLGMAKDEMAAKPMVLYESDDFVALASAEVAIRSIFPREIETSDPYEGEVRVWQS